MSDSINKGSNSNDALSADADRVIPRHTVDGKNAATGESSTFVNDLEPDSKKSSHSRDSNPGQPQGFNPNDGGVRTAGDGEQGGQYTDTKPIEQASESHSLPGPSSTGSGQKAKGHNPTQ